MGEELLRGESNPDSMAMKHESTITGYIPGNNDLRDRIHISLGRKTEPLCSFSYSASIKREALHAIKISPVGLHLLQMWATMGPALLCTLHAIIDTIHVCMARSMDGFMHLSETHQTKTQQNYGYMVLYTCVLKQTTM